MPNADVDAAQLPCTMFARPNTSDDACAGDPISGWTNFSNLLKMVQINSGMRQIFRIWGGLQWRHQKNISVGPKNHRIHVYTVYSKLIHSE